MEYCRYLLDQLRRTRLKSWPVLGRGWPDIETIPRCARFSESFRKSCSAKLREDLRRAWGVRPARISKSKNRMTLHYRKAWEKFMRISCTVNGAQVNSFFNDSQPCHAEYAATTMVIFSRGVSGADAERTVRAICAAAVEREMLSPSMRRRLVEICLRKSGRSMLANCPGLLECIEEEAGREWPVCGDNRCYLDGVLIRRGDAARLSGRERTTGGLNPEQKDKDAAT